MTKDKVRLIEELIHRIFFSTKEGEALLALWEELSGNTDHIFPAAQQTIESYGGPVSYMSYMIGKKSFVYDIRKLEKIYLSRLKQDQKLINEENKGKE